MTNEEREFHVNVCAADRSVAEVFTDDPIWIARMDRHYTAEKLIGQGKMYRVPTRKIVRLALLQRKASANGVDDENDQEADDGGENSPYVEAEGAEEES